MQQKEPLQARLDRERKRVNDSGGNGDLASDLMLQEVWREFKDTDAAEALAKLLSDFVTGADAAIYHEATDPGRRSFLAGQVAICRALQKYAAEIGDLDFTELHKKQAVVQDFQDAAGTSFTTEEEPPL